MTDNSSHDPSSSDDSVPYRLPHADNMEEVNHNFDTISALFENVSKTLEAQAEHTNQAMIQLATETNETITKITQDMRSILSSQTMMLVICIILVAFVTMAAKSIYEVAVDIIQTSYLTSSM